jgi:hypothetical protein
VTGEEVSERELRAAWESSVDVIALPSRPEVAPRVETLDAIEQLELFAA